MSDHAADAHAVDHDDGHATDDLDLGHGADDHDHAEGEGEPLGPVDGRAWAAAIGGGAVGVIVALVLAVAS